MSESIVSKLRAMARNYAGGHSWDHLDGEAVTQAADEVERLRASLEAATHNVNEMQDQFEACKAANDTLNDENKRLSSELSNLVSILKDCGNPIRAQISRLEGDARRSDHPQLYRDEVSRLVVVLRKVDAACSPKCGQCGASSVDACNSASCTFLESGNGENGTQPNECRRCGSLTKDKCEADGCWFERDDKAPNDIFLFVGKERSGRRTAYYAQHSGNLNIVFCRTFEDFGIKWRKCSFDGKLFSEALAKGVVEPVDEKDHRLAADHFRKFIASK